MPYTLSMGLLWFGLALVLGVVIGIALRSVGARRQLAAARSGAAERAELERARRRIAELEGALAATGPEPADTAEPVRGPETAVPVRDDLTVIEGLGDGVRDLCHGIGITTWAELAETEISLLRTMLDDAGPRFKTHDPTTWPDQARLLAGGRWGEFRALAASVRRTGPASAGSASAGSTSES